MDELYQAITSHFFLQHILGKSSSHISSQNFPHLIFQTFTPKSTNPNPSIPSNPEDGVVPLQVLPEQRPAQRAWTGLVTSMACALLAAGRVDAVLCVASAAESPKKRLEPRPILARTVEEAGEGLGDGYI